MTRYAVAIAIGPVGGFISAGRRSRDLWWGSTWLSHATVQVAGHLLDAGAAMHLPSEARINAIRPHLSWPDADAPRPELAYGGRVANHVFAELEAPDEATLRAMISEAFGAGRRWLVAQLDAAAEQAERRLQGVAPLSAVLDRRAFDLQRDAIAQGDDFLECFAAWSPVEEHAGAALQKANELLSQDKRARAFSAPTWTAPGRPKSDLDSGRDSVLVYGPSSRAARGALGVRPGEGLDALGLARRVAAITDPQGKVGRLPFPPVSRIAVEPWLEQVCQRGGAAGVARIVAVLSDALRDNATRPAFFSWCTPACDPSRLPERFSTHVFPFDASALLEGGVEALQAEVDKTCPGGGARATLNGPLAALMDEVQALHDRFGPPEPYYALVSMDGDGVGNALRDALPAGDLDELVTSLDAFADRVEALVRAAHHGRVLYAGGDDLAFVVPVHQLLPAIQAVYDDFQSGLPARYAHLRLSAGAVIAHVKADLRGVRRLAEDALKEAKVARKAAGTSQANGFLQLIEQPRGGVARTVKGPLPDLIGRLSTWQAGVQIGAVSLRTPEILDELRDRAGDDPAALVLARGRILAQLERDGDRRSSPPLDALKRHLLTGLGSWKDASSLADELRVASRLHTCAAPVPGGAA